MEGIQQKLCGNHWKRWKKNNGTMTGDHGKRIPLLGGCNHGDTTRKRFVKRVAAHGSEKDRGMLQNGCFCNIKLRGAAMLGRMVGSTNWPADKKRNINTTQISKIQNIFLLYFFQSTRNVLFLTIIHSICKIEIHIIIKNHFHENQKG